VLSPVQTGDVNDENAEIGNYSRLCGQGFSYKVGQEAQLPQRNSASAADIEGD